jgi:hypothetical protein
MKISMMGSKALCILGVLLFWANCGFGQVVTPSMDPTQSILMPSAAGWREKQSAGVGYHEGSGTRDLMGQQIYQFDTSGIDGNLAFTAGNVFVEVHGSQSTTDVQFDQFFEGQFNLQSKDSRLSIALAGNDFVTIGLGIRSTESADYIDDIYDSEITTAVRSIGSISVKTMDMYYFGLGFERVKEENSYAVDLTWNNIITGAAIHLGQPGGTQFKFEYSLAYSESQEKSFSGDLENNSHPQTAISRMSGELMFSGLLFAFLSEEKKIDTDMIENGQTVKEIKRVNNQGGVLWIPENGLSIGFYFVSIANTASYDDSISSFLVKVAYIF